MGLRFPSDGGWSHFVGAGFLWTVSERVATYTLVAPEFATGSGYVGGTAQIGVSFAYLTFEPVGYWRNVLLIRYKVYA